MIIALNSESSSPCSSPGREHCVVFLDKIPLSQCFSLYPGVQLGTGQFDAGTNPVLD